MMTFNKQFALTAAAALLVSTAASAQIFGDDYGTDLVYDDFNTGFGETGYYDAWDRDDDSLLSEDEFATGIYADWDTDNDVLLSENEFSAGADRWYGADYEYEFADYDLDDSGFIDQTEFGGTWDTEYYAGWDTDEDSLLSEDEFSTGLYETADYDEDYVLSVEEEGWFEGWFDGDDIEVEVEEVGGIF